MAKGTRFGRAGAGSGVAERRGRRALSPGRGRRARAAAVQLPRRRAADGAGHRRAGRRRAAPQRRRASRAEEARAHHATLIGEVVRMLCAGVDPRRPVGVQHPAGRRRPGDHRPAAGGRRGRQQPRAAHAAARRRQPARLLRPLRARAARHAVTAPRSGRSTSAACCSRDIRLTGRFERARGRSTWPACCATSTMRVTKRRRVCCGWRRGMSRAEARRQLAMIRGIVGGLS